MKVVDAETGEYTPVALWSDEVPPYVLRDICATLFRNIENASAVVCIDTETGKVVAEATEYDDDF